MKAELQEFIEKIEYNVGIKITVYDPVGNKVFGRGPEKVEEKFKEIYCNTQENFSLYRFKFNGKGYIIRIEGVGVVVNNYMYLIEQLANKTSSKNLELTKEEFFLSLLHGKADNYQVENYKEIFSIPDNVYSCAMLIVCKEGRTGEVVEIIKNYTSNPLDVAVEINKTHVAFVKFFDDEESDYRSYREYADFLFQSLLEETGMHTQITIGSVVDNIAKLGQSFSQATFAFSIKDDVNLIGDVHSYKEYMLVRILEDLPKSKLNEYLELLMDDRAREIFENEEMVLTADEFLENNLNVSETARGLFLHRNTLIYRLDKIENATGLDIRKFSDAVTFRLIKILSKQVNK